MGFFISKIVGYLIPQKTTRILLLGLNGAGKTTVLNKLKFNENFKTFPTIGLNVETV